MTEAQLLTKDLYVALYDFEARSENELSFTRGSIVELVSKEGTGWWKGRLVSLGPNSQVGTFPEPYTAPCKPIRALFDIPTWPQVPQAISVPKNQILYLFNKENKDWWRVFYNGKEGFVPSSYVKEVEEKTWDAIAVYTFNGSQSEDSESNLPQLSFPKGEAISVLKKDRNWWTGFITSKPDIIGQFPSNFVKLRDSHESLSRTLLRAESVPVVQRKAEDLQKTNSASVLQSEESKKEQIRIKVIEEIYTTEVAYKTDLMVMNNVYCTPLGDKKMKIIKEKEFPHLFSNYLDLLQLSEKLIRIWDEKKRKENLLHHEIGGPLFELAEDFKVYADYCVNHPKAVKCLEKISKSDKFIQFEASAMASPDTRGLNLNSYLIKPIQRICKYPILLKELLKNTPETHPEFESIAAAMDKIGQVVSFINENKRIQENETKLTEIADQFESFPQFNFIQHKRELAQELKAIVWEERESSTAFGEMYTNESVDYKLWLFNDLVLIGKAKKDKYKYIHRIILDKVNIKMKEGEKIGFEIRDDKKYKQDFFLKERDVCENFVKSVQDGKSRYSTKSRELEEAEAQRYVQKFEFVDDIAFRKQKKLNNFFGEEDVPTLRKGKSQKSKLEALTGEQLSVSDIAVSKSEKLPAPLMKSQSEQISRKRPPLPT